MSHQPATQSICANCAAPLDPQFRYCPQCSQKVDLHRLSLHDIFHDVVHYFTHADKGFFGLLKDLAVSTGKVAREYVTGKRKKYFPKKKVNMSGCEIAFEEFKSLYRQDNRKLEAIINKDTMKTPNEFRYWLNL